MPAVSFQPLKEKINQSLIPLPSLRYGLASLCAYTEGCATAKALAHAVSASVSGYAKAMLTKQFLSLRFAMALLRRSGYAKAMLTKQFLSLRFAMALLRRAPTLKLQRKRKRLREGNADKAIPNS